MEYIAFIRKENDDYVATVPDLNYTSSYGSSFEEAVHNIKEAAELYCEDIAYLPKASSFSQLQENAEIEEGSIPQIVDLKVEKNVRINIMMRLDILKSADERAAGEFGGNRSAYLQELVRRDTDGSYTQANKNPDR
jgi:predicted RNase H-like HicB family nuclease